MIRGQPPLEHLTGVPIQSARHHRSCVHIQANTRTLNLHWGLPTSCGSTGQDLIPVGNPRSHARGGPSPPYRLRHGHHLVRAQRDAVMGPILMQLWEDNYRVYGARKLWKAARRAGHHIGRDQVSRLMRIQRIEGVRRGKRVRTTKSDPGAPRHPDLVGRDFTATAPNQLWVTDLTFVSTWAGIAYVCFITDAFSRMIVGWRVAGHMRTTMVLDAIEMARWSRGITLAGLRCHSDAGSQFTSIRYGERLAEIGAVTSIGTVGDSFDNALAETVNERSYRPS